MLQTTLVVPVYAYEKPSAPSAPSAPESPDVPTSPNDVTPTPSPTAVITPTPTVAVTSVIEPTITTSPTPNPTPTEEPVVTVSPTPEVVEIVPQPTVVEVQDVAPTSTYTPEYYGDTTGKQTNDDNFDGDVVLETGDAEVNAGIANDTNVNTYNGPVDENDIVAVIEDNGAGSDSEIEAASKDIVVVDQDNELLLDNDVAVEANSGDNKITDNLGGSSTIKTGDADATVNVFNFGNANFANVSVAEKDVYEDDGSDLYLDDLMFVTVDKKSATTKGNGADSTNSTVLGTENTQIIFQDNFAEVDNNIDIEVNTGDNTIARSLGDANIETGDANVVANIVNFLNTNFVGVGDLLVGVVNLWDGFTGDVYLPSFAGAGTGDTEVVIDGNGAGSKNTTTISDVDKTDVQQKNTVVVNNTVDVEANTGDNQVNKNVGDSIKLRTGDVDTSINTTTVAGQNFYTEGDYLNLVFLNQNGTITPFYVDFDGNLVEVPQIYAETSDNGAYSENIVAISTEEKKEIVQNNTAYVNNNLQIDVNTGGNKVEKNVDSDIAIDTGDVSVMASISNFIGNNFVGKNLAITFINSLGEWSGRILPGWMKTTEDEELEALAEHAEDVDESAQALTEENEVEVSGSESQQLGMGGFMAPGEATDVAAPNDTAVNEEVPSEAPKTDVFASVRELFGGSEQDTSGEGIASGAVENDEEGEVAVLSDATAKKTFTTNLAIEGDEGKGLNLAGINPFKVLALAGLVVYLTTILKRKYFHI